MGKITKSTSRIILIDADVVSHFISAGEILNISSIFPSFSIKILDIVYDELKHFPNHSTYIDNLIKYRRLELITFPEGNHNVEKEYQSIRKNMFKGKGESACMAYAKFSKDIIASSNLKDIKEYCNRHSIDYLTTMDFLCYAIKTKVFTIDRCNAFISAVIKAGSKLPVISMEEHKCRDITFL